MDGQDILKGLLRAFKEALKKGLPLRISEWERQILRDMGWPLPLEVPPHICDMVAKEIEELLDLLGAKE